LLIESRQNLNRTKRIGDGYEIHHIIPKSLGGSDNKENLVLLTAREHYIAHWLLYKSLSRKDKAKMAYAFFQCVGIITSRKELSHLSNMR